MTTDQTFQIDGMHCASCVARIETALSQVAGVTKVQANLSNDSVVIGGTDVSQESLMSIATREGFKLSSKSEQGHPAQNHLPLQRKTMIAAALTLPVVILAMGGHVVPAFKALLDHSTNVWIQWALTTLVLFWPGAEFFRLGIPSLLRRHPDMNALVALGTLAAWGYSCLVLLAPNLLPENARVVYFEAAAVIVTLILLGRLLEARAKGRTSGAVAKLIGLRADTVLWVQGTEIKEIPTQDAVLGDHLMVRPGGKIALDGVVVEGHSHVDESMMSGEPIPVEKTIGDALISGTLNTTGALNYRVTAIGKDTALSRIIALVEEAQATRLPIQSLVNRITAIFVPAVLLIAAITVTLWLIFGPSLSHALVAGVSVLIIACPCALGLATPTSVMVGTGRAAELGVLFRKGDALQSLQDVSTVAFDKTGTLTRGKPELVALHVAGIAEPELLRLVGSAEQASEHPIAHAIVEGAKARGIGFVPVEEFNSQTGFGVNVQIQGQQIQIGSAQMMSRAGIEIGAFLTEAKSAEARGNTVIFAAIDGVARAVLVIADQIKPGAIEVITSLKSRGIEVVMISGDSQVTARAIARELGIETVIAGVRPDGKVAALEKLRSETGGLVFVGDGINDAPALAAADIGVALGTGTDVAIETADVVLIKGDLSGVEHAIAMSRATLRNIHQNLAWAFGYNLLLIPVAAGVLFPLSGVMLSPALASAAMALSSVFVVSNALRLRTARKGDV